MLRKPIVLKQRVYEDSGACVRADLLPTDGIFEIVVHDIPCWDAHLFVADKLHTSIPPARHRTLREHNVEVGHLRIHVPHVHRDAPRELRGHNIQIAIGGYPLKDDRDL